MLIISNIMRSGNPALCKKMPVELQTSLVYVTESATDSYQNILKLSEMLQA